MARAGSPTDRLAAFVRHLVTYHGERRFEAGITDNEFRHLSTRNRRRAVELRDRYADMLREILRDGVEAGELAVADVSMAAFAILTMGTHVSVWYRPDGRLSRGAIADQYVGFALQLAGAAASS